MANDKAPCDLLREARRKRGVSQERIAADMGVTQPCVSKWEKGTITPRDLRRAAEVYGISAKRLIAAFVAERGKAAA
jgi:transcriptional regulator with XRE-family HTH domain